MALSAGTRLGVYEIVAPLGAGGMGEVYRARDTRLDRQVAIKVLPDRVAQDPERLARFEREAKVLAALNHPNIAQIYAVEERALVMGTAGYMSPEQAAGTPVDRRADIWSFGVVLWELLTGKALFSGETVSHTLADVLRKEIDLSVLPSDTPIALRTLIARCLDRDV